MTPKLSTPDDVTVCTPGGWPCSCCAPADEIDNPPWMLPDPPEWMVDQALAYGLPRPRLLDLFCCEGGAGMGYHRAGFDVVGVDLFGQYTQRRYPFESIRGDVFEVLDRIDLDRFDAIHASPPCQRYSITNAARGHDYPDLIGPTRSALEVSGLPYVIENVVGAPLVDPLELCGCMFDLKAVDDDGIVLHLQRARLFESNVHLTAPRPHDHSDHEWVGGCYGGARRDKYEAKYVRKGGYVPPNKAVVEAYMGIDWMTWKGLHQAIPPAYTEHIGRQLADAIGDRQTEPAAA